MVADIIQEVIPCHVSCQFSLMAFNTLFLVFSILNMIFWNGLLWIYPFGFAQLSEYISCQLLEVFSHYFFVCIFSAHPSYSFDDINVRSLTIIP